MRIREHQKPFGFEKPLRPHGRIIVIDERCKGCGFCVEYCPQDVLELSSRFNKKGYHPPEAVNEAACVHCGFCRMICPEFAIYTVEDVPVTG